MILITKTSDQTRQRGMYVWGACHYLTNRFQMEAPVAPSRSLQEASVGMAEAFAKPSRSLLGGFSKPSAPATFS